VSVTTRPVKTEKATGASEGQTRKGRNHGLCVHSCGNCEKTYIGEPGRKFGTRLKHKTEVEATTNKPLIGSQRLSSLSEQNKLSLTDHASLDNRVINWPAATILDRDWSLTKVPDGSRKRYTSERRDDVL